jgi:hypothetical protein
MCMSSFTVPMDVGDARETPAVPNMSGTGERKVFEKYFLISISLFPQIVSRFFFSDIEDTAELHAILKETSQSFMVLTTCVLEVEIITAKNTKVENTFNNYYRNTISAFKWSTHSAVSAQSPAVIEQTLCQT